MTRGEAIDALDNLLGMVEDNHDTDYDGAIKMAIDALKQPERKRGRWENICSLQNWQFTYEHYRCSNCGIPAECAFRYCPNCGAEMKGEDDGLD